MFKHKTKTEKDQYQAEVLADQCYYFLRPLLQQLHQVLDRRLVTTFLDLVIVILMVRHRNDGLLLTELGSQLLSAQQTPAGAKRIARLLRSPRWQARLIADYFWQQGDQRLNQLVAAGRSALLVWDESVFEKPESLQAEGLCPVRSSKARRLMRLKPGYYNPPTGRPVFVPGYHWLQLLLMDRQGPVTPVQMQCWTTRGERAEQLRGVELDLLQEVVRRWGQWVLHIFDQGFAGSPWVSALLDRHARFVLRWKKGYILVGPKGEQKAWEISRGKRSHSFRPVYDAKHHVWRNTGLVYFPVQLPGRAEQLFLVVSRPGQGRKPWYLLTNEPMEDVEDAWRVVFAYARRWQVEMAIRFDKCELAFESPRLQRWEERQKYWLIAALAFAFLVSLLQIGSAALRTWLLDTWCHRTGQRSRKTPTPLYRLRKAICALWLTFRPPCLPKLNPGLN